MSKVEGVEGDILSSSRDWDLAMLVSRDFSMEEGPERYFRDRFGGVEDLIAQDEDVGGAALLLENVRFPNKNGEATTKTRHVFYGMASETCFDVWDLRSVFNAVHTIKTTMLRQGRNKVSILVPSKITSEAFRRVLEFVFFETEIEVRAYRQPRYRGVPSKARAERLPAQPKKFKEEAVIVKAAEGKSYASLLQDLKRDVNVEETGVNIASVRKTRAGDLLLAVKRGQEGGQAEKLCRAIVAKVPGIKAEVRTERKVILHVSGLDGVTRAEELSSALQTELDTAGDDEVQVVSIWPAFGGNQNASIAMKRSLADKLLLKGKLKVGWVSCRVRERVEVTKCFKCWGQGHIAADCTGISREGTCRRCGTQGHMANACTNAARCWECLTEGHRGGTTGCPRFREALSGANIQGRRRPASAPNCSAGSKARGGRTGGGVSYNSPPK